MFEVDKFYKTKNRSKVICVIGPDTHGDFCMKVISGGHGVFIRPGKQSDETYWVTSEGKYNHNPIMYLNVLTDKLHGMDIVGPWEETQKPLLTLTFETEVEKKAFLTWFLFAGGSQDMRAFSSEDCPECPNLASYDRDNKTISFSHDEGEHE